jgi:choline kinase
LEEQRRFIKSYVNHRPQFNPRASATPNMPAMDGIAKGSISEFLLDSRTPGGSTPSGSTWSGDSAYNYAEEEANRERETERQVEELLEEARIWRVANSAQWVAWGIVQAKVSELDAKATVFEQGEVVKEPEVIECQDERKVTPDKRPGGLIAEALIASESVKEVEGLEDQEDEFDYLAYSQDRAMFFWGDVVSLGIVKKEDLPAALVRRLKFVEY